MALPIWTFRKVQPGTKRDPFEAEFFTGDEEDEAVFGRTDALVREAIQNALDARIGNEPARVRFAISTDDQILSSKQSAVYLEGLTQHLDTVGNEVVNNDSPAPPMRFLVYEDFGTRGLCGDPTRTRDPAPGSADQEDFYWFWWNVGRSGKSGTDRGRWGLGKTVFHSTSRINTIFGLTVRSTDKRKLLMGQAVTKTHFIGDAEYPPEGFFHDPDKVKPIEQPIEDHEVIAAIEKTFGLRRGKEPGLSVVVPFRFNTLKAGEILRSVIVHYFLPVLRGELIVDVSGPDLAETTLTATAIRKVAASLKWDGKRTEKKHRPPPFDLADWAIQQQTKGIEADLKPAGLGGAPVWSDDLIDAELLESLRKRFAAHERIAVRVPMTVEKKVGGRVNTHFDVFIEHDEDLDKGEDQFIREGMTISKISTISSHRGIRGIVLVEHKVLSSLLGDAEGPAHNDWGRGEDRPDRIYLRWASRISYVKNSLAKLINLLTPPPEAVDEDLLSHIFSVADVKKAGKKSGQRKKSTGTTPPPPAPPLLPIRPKWYKVVQTAGGFRVRRSSSAELPKNPRLRMRVAYDLPDGDPFRNWSRFDFVFNDRGGNPIKFTPTGAVLRFSDSNLLVVEVQQTDFTVEVRGFDPIRDLVIRTSEDRAETIEESGEDALGDDDAMGEEAAATEGSEA